MLSIGIDPGVSGAVALLGDGGMILSIHDAPTIHVKIGKKNRAQYVETQMLTLLRAAKNAGTVQAFIENIHSMPGQGVTSMFSMGFGFGLWIMALTALEIPYTRVEPARWKKDLGIVAKADKAASVVRALQLFPRCVDLKREYKRNGQVLETYLDGRADALLIAEWGRRLAVRGSARSL